MNNTNETITDIIAEKRRRAEEIERVCADKIKRGVLVSEQFAAGIRDLVADIRQEADRFEAAWKREKAAIEADALAVGGLVEASRATTEKSSAVGDAAKQREALEVIRRMVNEELEDLKDISDEVRADFISIRGWCDHALAAPPRNCDVGTPEELSKRMANFCRRQYKKTDGVALCSGCRFHNIQGLDCQFAWAQMPYEEGGAK